MTANDSKNTVRKLAQLARIAIAPEFEPVITKHVASVLEYVERLSQVDTTGVEPMCHVHGAVNVLREDVVYPVGSTPPPAPLGPSQVPPQEMLPTTSLLENAPRTSGSFIHVPLIVE